MPTNPPPKPEPVKDAAPPPGRPPAVQDGRHEPEPETAPREDDKRIERFRER